MIVARSLDDVARDPRSVVTVGTFDGVHLAHREIIREVVQRAKMCEGRSVVVTFDPHPKEVVGEKKEPVLLLTTVDERIQHIAGLGIDLLVLLTFTYDFSRQSAREFYQTAIRDRLGVNEVIVGYDHMFGRDRGGDIEELVRMGREFSFSVFAVQPVSVEGEVVSSSLIRTILLNGDVERGRRFLGYPYGLRGKVVRGDGRGRTLGFPTANLSPVSESKLVPANGVYLVAVTVGDERHAGMMNIGVRPTVTAGTSRTVEVHLAEFDRDIYGEELGVTFLSRIREERRFGSREELVAQLHKDKEETLRYSALARAHRT
jgi:riboflavin kinase / FMN adenylyltransferase